MFVDIFLIFMQFFYLIIIILKHANNLVSTYIKKHLYFFIFYLGENKIICALKKSNIIYFLQKKILFLFCPFKGGQRREPPKWKKYHNPQTRRVPFREYLPSSSSSFPPPLDSPSFLCV